MSTNNHQADGLVKFFKKNWLCINKTWNWHSDQVEIWLIVTRKQYFFGWNEFVWMFGLGHNYNRPIAHCCLCMLCICQCRTTWFRSQTNEYTYIRKQLFVSLTIEIPMFIYKAEILTEVWLKSSCLPLFFSCNAESIDKLNRCTNSIFLETFCALLSACTIIHLWKFILDGCLAKEEMKENQFCIIRSNLTILSAP